MAIKAGRVGVAPNQVDEFGNISSEATSVYTKQEADAKFETQTHAGNTYQKIALEVPVELLNGSALTVESALNGINNDFKGYYNKPIIRVLTEADDLNDLNHEPTGLYYITSASIHSPEEQAYVALLNIMNTSGDGKQIVFCPRGSSSFLYMRALGGTPATWTSWSKFTGTII